MRAREGGMPETSFFMVWCIGGSAPTRQHPDYGSAKAEAERLARANKGQAFVVLESLSRHQVQDIVSFRYNTDRDIPF